MMFKDPQGKLGALQCDGGSGGGGEPASLSSLASLSAYHGVLRLDEFMN